MLAEDENESENENEDRETALSKIVTICITY